MLFRRDDEWKRLFTRRAFIFAGIKVIAGLSIVSRIGYLQILKSGHYKLLSDKNRVVTSQILPPRGKILDRYGKLIATNVNSYSVVLDLLDTPPEDRHIIVERIARNLPIDEETIVKILNSTNNINLSNRFVLLRENLSWSELSAVYMLSSLVPGLNVEKSLSREYIDPEIFSHIIGYVGTPTKDDIKKSDNSALILPMAKIGRCGIEKSYSDQLFGKVGMKRIEVNSKRAFVRTIDRVGSLPGQDICLTIDKELQHFVYNRLSVEASAVCIVMNVNTGAVLSLVSYPGYDSNIFNKKIDKNTLEELYKNPYKPMINKAISGVYSPGSSFKMITGLAGLTKGVIDKHTRFGCNGSFNIGKYKYHCSRWRYGGHGSISLRRAIASSCDVYFYNVAMMLSQNDIFEVANDFGLGVKTGIDMPSEKAGLMPTKAWKKQNRNQSWTAGDTINMSIGQGFTLTTPIQLVRMISIMVNGLKPITPYVCSIKEKFSSEKLKYRQDHVQIILDGMDDVVNDTSGTAYRSRLDGDFMFGGKTGSAQVCRITEKQRKERKTVSDDYWKKDHAIFVGYAPIECPEVAVCVLVEHGDWGSSKAAPIARDIFEYYDNNCSVN